MAAPNVAQLRTMVRAMMNGQSSAAGDLEPYWIDETRSALNKAIGEVAGILAGRGYSAAQITGGEQYYSVVEFQALYWSGVVNKAFLTVDVCNTLLLMDQRKYLETTAWVVGGVVAVPGDTGITGSASGGFAWPSTGTARNPLMTSPVPTRCGDIPFPGL